jgi:hypothetical protein
MPIMSVERPSNIYQEQLSSPYHGLALWKPNPAGIYEQVSIGDVGYVLDGAFIRMFNVTLPWDDESNRTLGTPPPYEFLNTGNVTIRRENFGREDRYSRPVRRVEFTNMQAASPDQ